MTQAAQQLADYVDAHVADWVGLLQALVRKRSVLGSEAAVVAIVARRLGDLGVTPHVLAHDASRSSLAVRVRGTGGGRSLVLSAHLDTVSEGDAAVWTHPPFAGHVDPAQNIMYGRGVMDDKAGAVIALAVLEALTRTGIRLRGDLLFHFVLENEIMGTGTRRCLEAGYCADAAVLIDGTRPDRAIDRHAGQLQFDVRVMGKPAAVGVSHLGVNAADALARFVARLADVVAALNVSRVEPWTRFPTPFQLVTQRLAADADPLTVPDRAEATCYMTFPPPATLAEMRRLLAAEAVAFGAERRLLVPPAIECCGFSAEPVASKADGLAAALGRAAASVGFGPVDVGPSTGTSDLRHFVAAGALCLLYGPGTGFNPHRPDERYHLDDLRPMVNLFSRLVIDWCGLAGGAAV